MDEDVASAYLFWTTTNYKMFLRILCAARVKIFQSDFPETNSACCCSNKSGPAQVQAMEYYCHQGNNKVCPTSLQKQSLGGSREVVDLISTMYFNYLAF